MSITVVPKKCWHLWKFAPSKFLYPANCKSWSLQNLILTMGVCKSFYLKSFYHASAADIVLIVDRVALFWLRFFNHESVTFNSHDCFHFQGIGGQCEPGFFCPTGSEFPRGCPEGTYQDEEGQDHCKACPAGYYCNANQSTYEKNECPKGHYCPLNTTGPHQYKCPAGTYQPDMVMTNSSACLLCPKGEYCDGTGNEKPDGYCKEGYYCEEGSSNAKAKVCEIGHFCPNGSGNMTLCKPGYYCGREGLSEPIFECQEGFYCKRGARVPNPTDGTTGDECKEGEFCPKGSKTPQTCPPGKFVNSTRSM